MQQSVAKTFHGDEIDFVLYEAIVLMFVDGTRYHATDQSTFNTPAILIIRGYVFYLLSGLSTKHTYSLAHMTRITYPRGCLRSSGASPLVSARPQQQTYSGSVGWLGRTVTCRKYIYLR